MSRGRVANSQAERNTAAWEPGWLAGAVMLAGALVALTLAGDARADPLKLEAGKPVQLVCETQSVVVAGEAKVSRGALRLRLEAVAEQGGIQAGTWVIVAVDAGHSASIGAVHKETCAQGCPIQLGPKSQPVLWAPKPILPEAMEGEVVLSVVAIDPDSLKLRASTFRSKDLAALEQGECRRE